MTFGQFMSYYKKKKNHQKIIQKLWCENQFEERNKLNFYWKMKFSKQATYICNKKTIEIYPNQCADLLRILFTDNSSKKNVWK